MWVKYFRSPTDGFIIDYWGATTAGRRARGADRAEPVERLVGGAVDRRLPRQPGGRGGRRHLLLDSSTSPPSRRAASGRTRRCSRSPTTATTTAPPSTATSTGRGTQANVAATYFFNLGSRSHNVKAGFDFQTVESGSLFNYPNSQYFIAESFNQATGTFVPLFRRDYLSGASTSKGNNYAFYVRDKFDVTSRLFVEAGLRFEHQTGTSDLGADTVDTTKLAPRVSASFDLSGDGKTIVNGSYGRFYTGVIQSFSDGFAGVPQQGDYDNFAWNGSSYVFQNSIRVGGTSFQPNPDLDPSYLDEFTVGFQRQFGRTMAAGVRFVAREWNDLIDDVRTFNPDGTVKREVAQLRRRGALRTAACRPPSRSASRRTGTPRRATPTRAPRATTSTPTFTTLGDYIDAQCRTTLDASIGTGGVIPCDEVQNGANKFGRPIYDRPHNFKAYAAYVRPIGPINLSVGRAERGGLEAPLREAALDERAAARHADQRRPDRDLLLQRARRRPARRASSGTSTDSLELIWRAPGSTQIGLKGEAFNLTNREEKTQSNNFAFCGATANQACVDAVNNFGKATARGSFQRPRNFRISAIFRF